MKITALIPDSLVEEVKKITKGKNITDSLLIALKEWVAIQKIRSLNHKIAKRPLKFSPGFNAVDIRENNRKR